MGNEKEEYLGYHCQMLVVAFGPTNTTSGATVHATKNLCVYDDFHAALKLMSIITRRKIVVRVANRFHIIKNRVYSDNCIKS